MGRSHKVIMQLFLSIGFVRDAGIREELFQHSRGLGVQLGGLEAGELKEEVALFVLSLESCDLS
jgi:hypothetical protein